MVSRATDIRGAVDRALVGRLLLTHPFYRRWEAGGLARAELTAYAEQYRYFEAAVPSVLRTCLAELPAGVARDAVARNLSDEAGGGGDEPHLVLFDRFAGSVGADVDRPPSVATIRLLSAHGALAAAGPVSGLAGLVAYERQSPAVAATKSAGLRRHYQPADTRFWDVHADIDEEHASWLFGGLAELDASPGLVESAASETAAAWWAFLDERERVAV